MTEILRLILRTLPLVGIALAVILGGVSIYTLIQIVRHLSRSEDLGNHCKSPQTAEEVGKDPNNGPPPPPGNGSGPGLPEKWKEVLAFNNRRACRYLHLHLAGSVFALLCAVLQLAVSILFLLVPSSRFYAVVAYCAIFLFSMMCLIMFTLTIGFFTEEASAADLILSIKPSTGLPVEETLREKSKYLQHLHITRKLLSPTAGLNLIFVVVFLIFNCDIIAHHEVLG